MAYWGEEKTDNSLLMASTSWPAGWLSVNSRLCQWVLSWAQFLSGARIIDDNTGKPNSGTNTRILGDTRTAYPGPSICANSRYKTRRCVSSFAHRIRNWLPGLSCSPLGYHRLGWHFFPHFPSPRHSSLPLYLQFFYRPQVCYLIIIFLVPTISMVVFPISICVAHLAPRFPRPSLCGCRLPVVFLFQTIWVLLHIPSFMSPTSPLPPTLIFVSYTSHPVLPRAFPAHLWNFLSLLFLIANWICIYNPPVNQENCVHYTIPLSVHYNRLTLCAHENFQSTVSTIATDPLCGGLL